MHLCAARRTLIFAALLALAALSAAEAEDLHFAKLNRTYTDFVPPLEEMNEGGVTVKLNSPTQALVLRDHRIALVPAGDGLFTGKLDLDIQGKGTVIADVSFGPITERFNELVVVPPQTISIPGKIRLKRVESGYAIEPVELPRAISVAIQSPTINSILALCDQAAILSLGSIDCGSLNGALTRPSMPIPTGQTFTLSDTELSPEERATLDALIAPAP